MTTETERAKQLARNHWGYIEATLATHGVQQEELTIIGHHYTTAMIHGFGHGVEAERRGDFRPRIGDPLPPEEVERISREVAKTPPLCVSCASDAAKCEHSGETVKWCGWYTSSLRERIAEAKEPQALDLSLPTIAICCTPFQILEKFKEEVEEYNAAEPGSMAQLIEAWDVIQVAQTYREHGGCSENADVTAIAWNLQGWDATGRPVMQAKRAMLVKNAARAMYSDKDNAAILATI
jgi:hypothetical protein